MRIDPGNVEALYSRAFVDVLTATGYFTDDPSAFLRAGEAGLTKVLSLAPDHAQAHGILGAIYIWTDRVAQGIAELERALELDRNLAWAHANIGQVVLSQVVGHPFASLVVWSTVICTTQRLVCLNTRRWETQRTEPELLHVFDVQLPLYALPLGAIERGVSNNVTRELTSLVIQGLCAP